MRRILRALVVLTTSTLVVCGVKGPPRPAPAESAADAGTAFAPSTDGGGK